MAHDEDTAAVSPGHGQPLGPQVYCPVVGIGASAGGLEAFTQFLQALPPNTGLAFVLVQHLATSYPSQLAALLAKTTPMPVVEATDGMPIYPNRVHVIPPGVTMTVAHGLLHLTAREPEPGRHRPIDTFLQSLATDRLGAAIGLVLSGSGTDGTTGIAAIKAYGGLTLAQDEASARCPEMPRNAARSGKVDWVLPPNQLAGFLVQHSQELRHLRPAVEPNALTHLGTDAEYQAMFGLLEQTCGVDFSQYKDTTVRRRLRRRMVLCRQASLADYVRYLQAHSAEVRALHEDIFIHLTAFFRDPEVFVVLGQRVFPRILQNKSPESPIRIWVPGCSTGQEVYSLAMVLREFLDSQAVQPPVQFFGTDISEDAAIAQARVGFYPPSIAAQISPERLTRFFTPESGGYRIDKTLRSWCVFGQHNVATDPPISKIDLISCRNLLIYLSGPLQQKVLPRFHYALSPRGFLLLGAAETIGRFTDRFALLDSAHKIYACTDGSGHDSPWRATPS